MRFVFRQHAIARMFERGISAEDVSLVLRSGRVIEGYPADVPYPSCLWLGYAGNPPLHIVFADNAATGGRIIVTVYEPGPALWEPDFATRKKP